MKNIHILPTDKPSRLHQYDFLSPMGISKEPLQWRLGKNIYITNSEEIKEGDWVFGGDFLDVEKVCQEEVDNLKLYKDSDFTVPFKKIILTTDQDLIADGLQSIDDEFLEWFVKNPSCENVEIIKIEDELISPKNPKIRFNALQDPPSFISADSLSNMILTYKYKIIVPSQYTEKVLLQSSIDGDVIWGEKQ